MTDILPFLRPISRPSFAPENTIAGANITSIPVLPQDRAAGDGMPRMTDRLAEFMELLGRTHRQVDIERPGTLCEGGISCGVFSMGTARWVLIAGAAFTERMVAHLARQEMREEGMPLAAAFGINSIAMRKQVNGSSVPYASGAAALGARDGYDGQSNFNKLIATRDAEAGSPTWPAVTATDNLSLVINGVTFNDFYIPAEHEMKTINSFSTQINSVDATGPYSKENWYWASAKSNENVNSYQYVVVSSTSWSIKSEHDPVYLRPVRRVAL